MTTRKASIKPSRLAMPSAAPAPTPAPAPKARKSSKVAPAVARGVVARGVVEPASAAPANAAAPATVDWKDKPISEISLANVTPHTLIAPNFMVYELTRSELADRRGIDNHFPSDKELRAAIHLAREVLQPIRDMLGKFTPNSVFRGNPLERALKNKPATWLSTSQHSRGEACDIEIVGMATLALANWARINLKSFDQIICECYDPAKGPNSGWVHISLKAPGSGTNRRQCLSYVRDPGSGRLVYVDGLTAMV